MFFTTLFAIGIGWFLAALLAGIIAGLAMGPALSDDDAELLDVLNWFTYEDIKEAWLVVWDSREFFYPAFTFFLVGIAFVTTAFINSPYA